MDLLITGVTILTMDPARRVFCARRGCGQGGRIAAIGPAADLPKDRRAGHRRGAARC
jgi:5-methylthioadenosine/S-adenosylhomocysteine deaminase